MGYYITIKNQLLEAKHVERMGAAVWLYMWLIDKVMAINENGIGKVFNGKPIQYLEVANNLGITQRTYQRWLKQLEDAGYIRTIRAPYGRIITITKASKMWRQVPNPTNATLFEDPKRDKNGASKGLKGTKKTTKTRQKWRGETTKMSSLRDKNVQSNKDSKSINSKSNDIKHAAKAAKSEIGQLYYQVIKAYDLPTTNHNVIWSKIRQWEKEDEPQRAINYLNFLLNQYPDMQLKYKPQLSTALDIYAKRAKIKNAIQSQITKSNQRKIMEV